jgi:hypothetical protein
MKPILLIAAFYAGLNAALLGSIGLTVGFPAAHKIHVGDTESMPMMTLEESGLSALLESELLSTGDHPRLIILGASGAALGFSPHLVEAMLPEYETSNLAVPAARMTEMLVVFDEVVDAVPASVLRRSVLVLGVTPISFWPEAFPFSPVMEPRLAWWEARRDWTLITQAAARSPALLDVRHPVRRMLPRSLVLAAKKRFRSWRRLGELLPDHPGTWLGQRDAWRLNTRDMKWHRQASEATRTAAEEPMVEHEILPRIRQELEYFIALPRRFGRPYDPHQFDAFSTLVRRATASGMRVVVVDMPLHSEHIAYPEYASPFQKRLAEVMAALNAATSGEGQRVANLDLTTVLDDQYFASLAHASKAGRPAWVGLLVERLRPLLAEQRPNRDP